MTLTLDAATEQPIQQKIELGQFRDPAEVIARALDLLNSEESWTEEENPTRTSTWQRAWLKWSVAKASPATNSQNDENKSVLTPDGRHSVESTRYATPP